MVCQYPTPGPVSSEKDEVIPGTGTEERGGHTAGIGTVTVVMGSYWTRPERLAANSLRAIPATSLTIEDALEIVFI
jgi:hypothetical protein